VSIRQEYAERIRALRAASVEAFVATGQELLRAKDELPHGEFEGLVREDLGWSRATSARLMEIARHPIISDVAHVRHLPPAWGTLYKLTRLDNEVLESALGSGAVHPGLERKDVAALGPAESLPPQIVGRTETVKKLESLIAAGRRYGTVYADPPWAYSNQGTRAATSNHYGTESIEYIAGLPVSQLAAENAHLHLWTTNAFLFDARRVMEAWGFEYKSCFVWVKPQMGIGNYWRVSHEFMLLGVRGSTPFGDRGLMSWARMDRTKHSAKPESVRRMIEAASPGPRLELFGRRKMVGWTVWGDQIEGSLFVEAESID